MGFIDSYKRLEKICGEIMGNERRVSAYIDEMARIPNGSYYVKEWDEDLKKLKRYRWIRNKIVHDPGCSEENMCDATDTVWIDHFYSRIINQSDPLALYRKAIASHQNRRKKYAYPNFPEVNSCKKEQINRKDSTGPGKIFAGIVFLIAFIIVLVFVLHLS